MAEGQILGVGIVIGLILSWTFIGIIYGLMRKEKTTYEIRYDATRDNYLLTTESDVDGIFAIAVSDDPKELEEKYRNIIQKQMGYPKKLK